MSSFSLLAQIGCGVCLSVAIPRDVVSVVILHSLELRFNQNKTMF